MLQKDERAHGVAATLIDLAETFDVIGLGMVDQDVANASYTLLHRTHALATVDRHDAAVALRTAARDEHDRAIDEREADHGTDRDTRIHQHQRPQQEQGEDRRADDLEDRKDDAVRDLGHLVHRCDELGRIAADLPGIGLVNDPLVDCHAQIAAQREDEPEIASYQQEPDQRGGGDHARKQERSGQQRVVGVDPIKNRARYRVEAATATPRAVRDQAEERNDRADGDELGDRAHARQQKHP